MPKKVELLSGGSRDAKNIWRKRNTAITYSVRVNKQNHYILKDLSS